MDVTHVTIASEERAVLHPDPKTLLAAVQAIARIAGPHLLMFCVVDDHAHELVGLDRPRTGSVARALARGLGAVVPVDLAPSRLRPVEGRSHLVSLVRYVLDQPRKHGLQHAGHPALWPGSCFVDLVGARLTEGFDPRLLAAALPRLGRADLYDAVGMKPVPPLGADELRAEGPTRIGSAAAAAVGVADWEGRSAPEVRARRAAARLCRNLGYSDRQTAFGLRCPRSTVTRLALSATPDPTLDRAIALQLALRRAASMPMNALPFTDATR